MDIYKKNLFFILLVLLGISLLLLAAYYFFFRSNYHSDSQMSNIISPESNITEEEKIARERENIDTPDLSDSSAASPYPIHTDITATIFWVGEPKGEGSSENNAISAWDDAWQEHFGCFDDPVNRNGYHPAGCTPKENPFYFDLPYDDFDKDGTGKRKANAFKVVPWAGEKGWEDKESMLKNRWIKIIKEENVCYGQWEDAGPYVYNDASYVFGQNDERPKNKKANSAGMDVSPALRDCLKFDGLNNTTNKVSWQFVEFDEVPDGPWKEIMTISGTFWK